MEKYVAPDMEIIDIEKEIGTFGPIVPCHSQEGNQDAGSGTNP